MIGFAAGDAGEPALEMGDRVKIVDLGACDVAHPGEEGEFLGVADSGADEDYDVLLDDGATANVRGVELVPCDDPGEWAGP